MCKGIAVEGGEVRTISSDCLVCDNKRWRSGRRMGLGEQSMGLIEAFT